MDLFSMHDHESAIALVYEGEKDKGRVPTVENIGVIELSGDGDFRELATTYELVENEEGLLKIAYSDGTFLFDEWLKKDLLLKEYLA